MKTKAVIYARVSTSEQTKGYSLPSQVKGCQAYAKQKGLEITAVFKEDISGATHLNERPEGNKLLALVEQGHIQAVIVWRLDRLSRPPEGEYSRLLTTIEYLARYGVSVHDCETGEVKNDMTSIMIAFFKGLAASQERAAIRERTMRGIQEKAQERKWIGQGDPPFGFRKVGNGRDAFLEIHEEFAAVVRRIFALYIGKDGKPLTLKQIAVLLTHENVPTPGEVKKGGKTGRGGWYPSTISKRILSNRNYLGYFTAQEYTWHQPELAIIDQETWDKAQARKEANRKAAKRNRKRKYLLASCIKCICGGAMVGLSKKRRKEGYNVYYHCLKRRYDHIEKCPVKYLRADAIESKVRAWLCDLLSNPQLLDEGLQHMADKAQVETEPTHWTFDKTFDIREFAKKAKLLHS
jgi:site-specific DNA recombinase